VLAARGTATDDSAAFVVQDGTYVSARWPGDAYLFAKTFLALVQPRTGTMLTATAGGGGHPLVQIRILETAVGTPCPRHAARGIAAYECC
jgi:hypothetical protein